MSTKPDSEGHKRCGAKTRSGKNCGLPAGHGTDHVGYGSCKLHGGCTPNHEKAAKKQQARDAVEKYALSRVIDPHEALVEELHRTAGWVAFLNEQVQGLSDVSDMRTLKGGGNGALPEETPHIWIQMLARERDRLVDVAKTCIAVGIEERRVRMAEEQGQLMAQVVRGILADLDVPLTPEVQKVVRKNFTVIDGGKAA